MKRHAAARKRDIAAIVAKTDATIDFSEIAWKVVDWTGPRWDAFNRPANSR